MNDGSFHRRYLKQSRRAETAVILVAVSCIMYHVSLLSLLFLTTIHLKIMLNYYYYRTTTTDVIQKK
jgi:hypothetical protein